MVPAAHATLVAVAIVAVRATLARQRTDPES
jgi:hypothetical protein